jgi:hypothetical protein
MAIRPIQSNPPAPKQSTPKSSSERRQEWLQKRGLDPNDIRVRLLLQRANGAVSDSAIGQFLFSKDELAGYADLVGKTFDALLDLEHK